MYKTNENITEKRMSKEWENNERSPIEGVYTREFVWPYPPRTFFYRDNRSSRVSSLFSAVLGRHSCTKSMGMS